MSTAIRTKRINEPNCLSDINFCREPTNNFHVTVMKNDMGQAKPVYVHTYGLQEEECLLISRVYDEKCDPLWSPMYCGGEPMCLTCDSPDIMLVVPGKYRFQTHDEAMICDIDFAYEECPVNAEYASLYLQQQSLCCCRSNKEACR